tara:strand:+ start:322 stop:744 length:423 start_codon:yes stop_codon:yes gene_type:complete
MDNNEHVDTTDDKSMSTLNTNQYVKVSEDDINKQCAEALGWEKRYVEFEIHEIANNHYTYKPDNSFSFDWKPVSTMHFHDSFDWAMLLVKHMVKSKELHLRSEALDDIEHELACLFGITHTIWASPLQISTACLSVLGGE